MTDFKVGQRVWSFNRGWGVVTEVQDCDEYPVLVVYGAPEDEDECWYTANGADYKGSPRSIFFKEIPIPDDALIPPVEELVLRRGDVILFDTGEFGYVSHYSGPDDSCFTFHGSVPQGLDDAYSQSVAYKSAIKKVVGSIDD